MFPKQIGEICLPDDEDEIEEFKYEEKLPDSAWMVIQTCTSMIPFVIQIFRFV